MAPVRVLVPQPVGVGFVIGADIASLAVIAGLAATVLLAVDTIPRLVLALVFVTTVPGWAFVRGTGLAANSTGVAMAIPLSLAICAGASTVMVWLGAWHPFVLFGVLAAASAAVIGWALRPHLTPALVAAAEHLRR